MLQIGFALALALFALTPEAHAQGGRGTQTEQDACRGDARRHCRKVLGDGDFAVLECLQQNKRRLSQACRKVVDTHGR